MGEIFIWKTGRPVTKSLFESKYRWTYNFNIFHGGDPSHYTIPCVGHYDLKSTKFKTTFTETLGKHGFSYKGHGIHLEPPPNLDVNLSGVHRHLNKTDLEFIGLHSLLDDMQTTKLYPFRGLIIDIEDSYGVFPDIYSDLHWPNSNVCKTPRELGIEFGKFLSENLESKGITLDPIRDLEKDFKQQHVLKFVNSGKITSLSEDQFGLFKRGLKNGYLAIADE